MFERIIDTTAFLLGIIGALVVFYGSVRTALLFAAGWFRSVDERRDPLPSMEDLRLGLGRFLTLGLEFLIGGDIIRTLTDRSWHDLATLGALIILRSLLSYFLQAESRMSPPAPRPRRLRRR